MLLSALLLAAVALAAPADKHTLAPRALPQPPNGAHREFYVGPSPLRLALNYTSGGRRPPDGTAVILADGKFVNGLPTAYTKSTWRAVEGWRGVVKQYDSDEMCLDVGHGPRLGSKVKVWNCHGQVQQTFEVDDRRLRVAGTGGFWYWQRLTVDLCVGYPSAVDGVQAELVGCGDGRAYFAQSPGTPPSSSAPPTSSSPAPGGTGTPPAPVATGTITLFPPNSGLDLRAQYPTSSSPDLPPGTPLELYDSSQMPTYFGGLFAQTGWSGVIKVHNRDGNTCVDASSGELGAKIALRPCSSTAPVQQWVVDQFRVQLANTGLCIGHLNTDVGSQAELVSCQNPAASWNREPNKPINYVPGASSSAPPTTSGPTPSPFPQPSGGAHREFYRADSGFRLALDYTGGAQPNFRRPPDGTKVQLRDGQFVDGRPTTRYTWSTWRAVQGWRGVIKQYDAQEMCLDAGSNAGLGSKIVVNGCTGSASQIFVVSQFGLQLADTGFCVGVTANQEAQQAELVSCQNVPASSFNQGPNQPYQYTSSALPSRTSVSATPNPPTTTGSTPPTTSRAPSSLPQPSGGVHREFYRADSGLRLALDYTGGAQPNFRRPPDGTKVTIRDRNSTPSYNWSTWRAVIGWRGVIKQYDTEEMCLDAGPNAGLGSKIVLNGCVGGASQTFVVDQFRIQLADTGFCVGVTSNGNGQQAELVSCQNSAAASWNQSPNQPFQYNPASSSGSTVAPSTPPAPTTTRSTGPSTTGYPQPSGGAHREFYPAQSSFRLALNYTGGAQPNFRKPPDGTAVIYADGKFQNGFPTTRFTWSTWRAVDGWVGVVKQYDSEEKCLDVGHGPRVGSKVKIWGCHGGPMQQFTVSKYRIQVTGTNLCVGTTGYPSEGLQAELVDCGSPNSAFNTGPNKPPNSR
ncbi:hypothetical protein Q8F55_003567 [Vanrija albida]|uniref:Ricin B lectin domain-containing protein n=1 Tax=Vanrija albida TaxID=181172 RepID=A0ABR3Q542_9TREE